MSTRPSLSVIVPAYRCAPTVGPALSRLDAALVDAGIDFEVIVVADGDASVFREATRLASPRVRVTGYAVNRGKGFALRYGISQAAGEMVSFIDADGEIEPASLVAMVRTLVATGADIVVGSKRHPLSRVHYPQLRRLQSRLYHALTRALFDVHVGDTQTGLKVMRREVAERVLEVARVRRFAFDLEVLVLARHLGYDRISEAPVVIRHRFTSTTNLGAAARVLWDTVAIYCRLRVARRYDRADAAGWRSLAEALPPLLVAE